MEFLDGYKPIIPGNRPRPRGTQIFILSRPNMVEFSSKFVKSLGYAPYVTAYVDRQGKRIAFVASKTKTTNTFEFSKKRKDGPYRHVIIARLSLAKLIREVSGVGEGYFRFYGEGITDEGKKLIVVDLSKPERAVPVVPRKK